MRKLTKKAADPANPGRRSSEAEAPEAPYEIDPELANPAYQEILKLDRLLAEAGKPHLLQRAFDGWQVFYPVPDREGRCQLDALEHGFSYGHEADRLDIMRHDGRWHVEGWKTAEEVLMIIEQLEECERK